MPTLRQLENRSGPLFRLGNGSGRVSATWKLRLEALKADVGTNTNNSGIRDGLIRVAGASGLCPQDSWRIEKRVVAIARVKSVPDKSIQ